MLRPLDVVGEGFDRVGLIVFVEGSSGKEQVPIDFEAIFFGGYLMGFVFF